MIRDKIKLISPEEYKIANFDIPFGTRISGVVQRLRGRRHYLLKGWNNTVGELRSEYLAANVGKALGISVQQDVSLCVVDDYFRDELELGNNLAVLSKIDIRRQRDSSSGILNLEDMIGADMLINLAVEGFASSPVGGRRKKYILEAINNAVELYEKKHPESVKVLKMQIFLMCFFDAVIGGTDRHEQNWGIVHDAHSKEFIRLARLYDNGISLGWDMLEGDGSLSNHFWVGNRQKRYIKATSPIRNSNSLSSEGLVTRYTLIELCVKLYKLRYTSKRELRVLLNESHKVVTGCKMRRAILEKPPIDERFQLSKMTLGITHQLVCDRYALLHEKLKELII